MLFEAALVATIYNGLLYPEMGTIAARMQARGQHVQVLWHDAEASQTVCPRYILGHSMGGVAAIRQAARCAAAGHAPKAIVTIDPTGTIGTYYCPKGVACLNYYDPSHLIGGGARAVVGAHNVVVKGYTHLQLPSVPLVVRGALAATK